MTEELQMTLCPACGSESTQAGELYNMHQLQRCNQCGFVFTKQRSFPTNQYDDVYSGVTAYQMMLADARDTYEGKKGFGQLWWFKRKGLRWIHSRMASGRILDVGSGPGTLLMVANRKYGFEIQGIEPASAAAEIANKFGVPTFRGTIEEFEAKSSDRYDAITSFEVLEHVADPLSVLSSVRRLLKQGGILVISVPNLDDPFCLKQQTPSAVPPIHINFFSRRSINALLERAGFQIRQSVTLPIPTSSVRNLYGVKGFIFRLPLLVINYVIGRADGTTLLVMASAND